MTPFLGIASADARLTPVNDDDVNQWAWDVLEAWQLDHLDLREPTEERAP